MNTTTRTASIAGLALCVLLPWIGACTSTPEDATAAAMPPTFAAHRAEARRALERNRKPVGPDRLAETEWNLPREWRPAGTARKGVLLVHGLGDSPWSFVDVAPRLADQGYLVRTVLLPGHGTTPSDLLEVRLEDWQRVVREQVAALREDVPEVYLGGFSTGANLVTAYALQDEAVAGLLLYSPAFRSGSRLEWLTPWLTLVKPWLLPTGAERPQQTPVRYLNTPTNGFAQYYRSNVAARQALAHKAFAKPALLVMAEHDSVVDAGFVFETFGTRFTHPASRLIWYGATPAFADGKRDARVLARPDVMPNERISQFSHMSVLFSPANTLYGRDGKLRLCHNGQDPAAYQRCEAGEPVWYSDWGYQESGKVHARLTFNPYFEWQTGVMLRVLDGMADGMADDGAEGGSDGRTEGG
jgi:alpha-beta hydrolase superfamily lysophospholipase